MKRRKRRRKRGGNDGEMEIEGRKIRRYRGEEANIKGRKRLR